jgi:predicted amidophosphoribosyltransferase
VNLSAYMTNTHMLTHYCLVDPFGNDFFCVSCHQELGNAYMHCNGCEDLLQKDYNICITCHSDDEKLMTDYQMHPFR